ncbi:hypothetical protein SCUCBS95973_007432 [Sporothrix curviconia]|uniref:SET domain-containing protein n=1 Tax=Sporothrix curviconia TaxID=1260050 RepID=A0ABP0CD92_9PEZI
MQSHSRFVCPVTLDSASAQTRGPSSWSPWTHPPTCSSGEDVVPHGKGGLSIVTTPETAAASMDLWDEDEPRLPPEAATGKRQHHPRAYKIVDIPGRGKGILATRNIKQHEAFMVDYAALVVDLDVADMLAREAGYSLLSVAAEQVSPALSAKVLGLAQTSTAALHPVENVLRSNAFHAVLGADDDSHMAVFPDLSRINHACMPNAFPRLVPRSLAVSVAAARDIAPGEEITISYISLGQTRDARQKALLRWEFECKCPLCNASDDEVTASDAHRTAIDEMRVAVAAVAHSHDPETTDGDRERALDTIRDLFPRLIDEGMFTAYSEQYANAGRIYWALGDYGQARFYAQRSLDVLADQGFIAAADERSLHMLLQSFDGQ